MIRAARIEDVPVILEMLQASAVEQGFPDAVAVSAVDLATDGFGPNPRIFVALAEIEGTAAAMALYFFNYSTWGSRLGLYLEDLYVRPSFRKHGLARALLVYLARLATDRECGRFQWVVHSENRAALKLYESIGAHSLTDWRLMSLKGKALQDLAHTEDDAAFD